VIATLYRSAKFILIWSVRLGIAVPTQLKVVARAVERLIF